MIIFLNHIEKLRGWILAGLLLLNGVFFTQTGICNDTEGLIFDLRNVDFERDEKVELKGETIFFWQQFLTSYPKDSIVEGIDTMILAKSWHKQKGNSLLGYGTYYFEILLPESQSDLTLFFPLINSASKIFINGNLAGSSGTIGESKYSHRAQLTPLFLSIPEQVSRIEVFIQVSNFSYFTGGIVRAPIVQKRSSATLYYNVRNGMLNFFVGSLIAMFIFQIVLYSHQKKDTSYLWLSLICLCVALRSWITNSGSLFLHQLFHGINTEFWWKVEFFCVYSLILLMPLYIRNLFPHFAKKWPFYIFAPVALILCLSVILFPQYIYGQLLEVCHILLLFGVMYAAHSTFEAYITGNKEAKLMFVGIIFIVPFVVYEIYQNSLILSNQFKIPFLVEIGVLIFLMFQVFLLANRYEYSFKALTSLNNNLEAVVKNRTIELEKSNEIKDKLISIMSHDLKGPLNSLKSTLDIFHLDYLSKEEFTFIVSQIEAELNKSNLLLDNLLTWSANQLRGIVVNKEEFDLIDVINENLNLFSSNINNKKIRISKDYPKNMTIHSDRFILNSVIRNLIANAIKFSHLGGVVSIGVYSIGNQLSIEIIDEGIGMDDYTLGSLNGTSSLVVKGTANELGTGLGLMLCKDYLKKIGAHLKIESNFGTGSKFIVIVARYPL